MSRCCSTTPADKVLTIQELTVNLAKAMGVDSGFSPIRADRSHLSEYLPTSQSELPPRAMRDSYLVAMIPLSTSTRLQDRYTTFLGYVRVGRLLEDMDIFAVMVAQKHILNPKLPEGTPSPQTLVTALVDRIDFSDFVPKPHEDIKISGHVSWVGRSSMEVVVWLEQKMYGTWHRITRALFLIAARDPTNTKAAMVNAIEPADDREKAILAGGETRKANRIALEKQHVLKVIPDHDEQRIIHDLYLKTKSNKNLSFTNMVLPANGVWMEDCTISNTIFSQPENRNLHNTVFGGFIMRQAAELSWVLGFKFSKYRPKVKSISDIKFNKPIAVNSLIHMYAHVVFTQMQFIQIVVYVEVFDPQTGNTDTTNVVHLTYEVPEIVREVYPRTYQEAMMYIDGRRHFFEIMKTPYDHDNVLNEEGIRNKSKL
ncbi:acyl-coenzyme A thioesterase 10, mitochondrial isoform X2 [Tribolium castaneum]